MDRRNTLGTALVALAVVLFTVPALFPVQPMLVHETWASANGSPEELEERGHEIVAYENLSERGQQLYVKALENGGEYRVPLGDGASDFDYLNRTARHRAYETGNRSAVMAVVIERPEDDSHLPPADEPRFEPEDEGASDDEQRRAETTERYDAMATATEEPPLGATPQLLRLGAVLLAVLSMGVGGYLLSSK